MKILIVDDDASSRSFLAGHCDAWGFEILTANNGEEGVIAFLQERPNLVLMDVLMPGMSGFEAVTKIRELSGKNWVPIILVNAIDGEEGLTKGVESGADGYILAPVNLTVLREKIRVMERISEMQKKWGENLEELSRFRARTEEEFFLAKNVIDKVIRSGTIDRESIQQWILPAEEFSGDVIAAARTPRNGLCLILADAAGHGLPAALIALPVMEVFFAMVEKGSSLQNIAEEINYKIRSQMPPGCFVAATLALIDPSLRRIEVWNGGNPLTVFVDSQGRILHGWESIHLPLGVSHQEEFDARTEVFHWKGPGQLILCSDGLIEAEDAEGNPFGRDRLARVLAENPMAHRFQTLIDAVHGHLGGRPAHDDISLLAVHCRSDSILEENLPRPEAVDQWRLSMVLGPEKLRLLDLVPFVLSWLGRMDIRKTHHAALFVILSELLNNALDHGILKLDSALKAVPEGFEGYLREREKRLVSLSEGEIEIGVEHLRKEGRRFLMISVRDTGSGFDHRSMLESEKKAVLRPSHRGIPLVKSLCSEIRYLGNGNKVIVRYPLDVTKEGE
ncbi:MAG: fused response regulator/phosphatase [Candidatus Manganitrophaceae bacterium]